MTDTERHCYEMLNHLRMEYEKAAAPYVKILTELQGLKLKPPMVVVLNTPNPGTAFLKDAFDSIDGSTEGMTMLLDIDSHRTCHRPASE